MCRLRWQSDPPLDSCCVLSQNELTGEHSCIMLQSLQCDDPDPSAHPWLQKYHLGWSSPSLTETLFLVCKLFASLAYYCMELNYQDSLVSPADFRCRFLSLLSYQFRAFSPTLALSILHFPGHALSEGEQSGAASLSWAKLEGWLSPYDLKRLLLYSRNMADHHLITDLLPTCEHIILCLLCAICNL